jgi:hypothetical protein
MIIPPHPFFSRLPHYGRRFFFGSPAEGGGKKMFVF